MRKKIISFLLVIVLLSISVISLATSTQDLNMQLQEINENINENEGKISDIEKEKDTLTKQLEQLNNEIAAKEDEIEQLTEELKQLNDEITKTEAELEEEQKKYDEQYDLFCKRMIAQYKMGNVSYLDVLLNSKSITDFLSKYYIIEKIAEYDNKLLIQIDEQKKAIEKAKVDLEEKKNVLTEKQSKLKVEQISLTNTKINKNRYVAQLTDEEKELQKQIEEYTEQKRQVENEISRAAAVAAQSSQDGVPVYAGGKLAIPCKYNVISSRFGYRGSAATGGVGSANHKGMDFAAPKGTSIVASESGTVIKVSNTCTHNYAKTYRTRCSCGGGFGNYVMVSHGGGLVTLYAHCTSINVNVGDTVTVGQQIATVGTTGYSTGAHLHFSVLLNGTYVDPAPYLGL